jgi:hypothetical protein
VPDSCFRLVVNKEPVGHELGIQYGRLAAGAGRDVFGQGECDAVFLELAGMLGWLPELAAQRDALSDESRRALDRALAGEK